MPNKLELGKSRIGDFIDFNDSTPPVQVTLVRTEQGISVTIPWSGPSSPYAGWFMPDRASFLRPGDEAAEPAPMPRRVLFHDSHGSVLLLGCRARGFHANILGPGSGTLWARAAILGIDNDCEFDKPHALRTHISGLREWLGITSWHVEWPTSEDPRHLFWPDPPDKIEVGARNGITLSFDPAWEAVPSDDEIRLRDLIWCTTDSPEPFEWDSHLRAHHGVRDLLVLSRWRRESCIVATLSRKDDLLPSVDGTPSDHWRWRDVVVTNDEPNTQPSGRRPHLFRYKDLGPEGLQRWLELRDQFARALDPVISCVALPSATPHTLLAHCGPGLEALGYLLLLRDGASANSAGRASLHSRLARMLADVGVCLPFDGDQWAASMVRAYNGLKHANREEPDELDVLNAWRESVLVVRAWVAVELGIDADTVKARLLDDPQRQSYVAST